MLLSLAPDEQDDRGRLERHANDTQAELDDLRFMLKKFLSKTQSTIPQGQRLYAVGDVHGRLDLLDQLLNLIERDNEARGPAQVTLILLGDLIDRGPDSKGVVARVRAGVAWARVVALMGNHESIMLDALDGKRDVLGSWLRFGGRQTLASWGVEQTVLDNGTLDEILGAARKAVAGDERAWIGRMRRTLRIGDYLFVHAGIRPDIPFDKQLDEDCLWIREEFLKSRKNHGAMIVHGHSISAAVEERANRIGLDTGAYASGRLTALGLEGRHRWFLESFLKVNEGRF